MKEILGAIVFASAGMALLCLTFMLVDLWLGCVFSNYLEKKIRKLLCKYEEGDDGREN